MKKGSLVEVRVRMYEVFSLVHPYDGPEIMHGIFGFWSSPHDGREGAVEQRDKIVADYRRQQTDAVVMIREAHVMIQGEVKDSNEPPPIRRPWHTR